MENTLLQLHTPARSPRSAPTESTGRHSVLRDATGLDVVERIMFRLATGGQIDLLGAMATEHLAAGGKRLRARLALGAAEALGVAREDAAPWAAAVELLHNATLVHDDVQDGDTVRRGEPTVWARHGVPQAINTGDLLLMLPTLALDDPSVADDGVRWRLSLALARSAAETARGQALELDLLRSGRLDAGSWDHAAHGKTAGLLALPVEGAALLAGRPSGEASELGDAFAPLGMLFQLQDDVLDLYGDKGRGRVGNDLYEGKVSALVVEHLLLHPEEREWLVRLLSAPAGSTHPRDVQLAIERFRSSGALERVLDRVHAIVEATRQSLVLAREPALRDVALELASVALAPIAHLLNTPETR